MIKLDKNEINKIDPKRSADISERQIIRKKLNLDLKDNVNSSRNTKTIEVKKEFKKENISSDNGNPKINLKSI